MMKASIAWISALLLFVDWLESRTNEMPLELWHEWKMRQTREEEGLC
jgi:hypothetical protein